MYHMKSKHYTGSVKMAALAALMLCGAARPAHATFVPPFSFTYTYEFEATSGDTAFNGSTVTLGIYNSIGVAALDSWNIKDPKFPGGITPASSPPSLYISTVTSYSPSAFNGMFELSYYYTPLATWEYITVSADGSGAGSISDSEPSSAQGIWTPVPESASTLFLLAFAVAALAGVRPLHEPALARSSGLWPTLRDGRATRL
jgi:hypothetical protein